MSQAVIAVVVIAAFWPAVFGSFQQWDDAVLLLDNPAYRGLALSNLRWMFTTTLMGHYMPLTWISYGIDYLVAGVNPSIYHLSNILLHAANAVLVYLIAERLFRAVWQETLPAREKAVRLAATGAALTFGLHPLRVESVAWITERRDVLSGFFFLLTILLYLRACEVERRYERRWRTFYWMAVGCSILAMLSKSMTVTLPVVLVLLDLYPLRRLRPGIRGWLSPGPWTVWQEKLPFVFGATVISAVAFGALHGGAGATSWDHVGLVDRIAISAYSIAFYLRKTLLPLDLSPLYQLYLPVRAVAPSFLISGAFVLAATLVAVAVRRQWPAVFAVWTYYLVMLLPVAGIFHNGYQIVADRYSYLPTVGWALLAGGALLLASDQLPRAALAGLVVVPIAALGLATWSQAKVWHDDETLWRHAVRLDPASSIAASNLGSALRLRGKLAEAIEESERALSLHAPRDAETHLNLGLAKGALGRAAEAERHFDRVLTLKPRSAAAHGSLGALLERQGRLDEAVRHFRLALEINPRSAAIHNDFGVALARNGRISDALPEFLHAVRIDPAFAVAQNNAGKALAETGRLAEAAAHFRAAVHAKPDFQEARQNLDRALRLLGR